MRLFRPRSTSQCPASGSELPSLHGGMESADLDTGCHTADEPRWSVRGVRVQGTATADVPSHGRVPRQRSPRSLRAFLRNDPSIDTSGTPQLHETTIERSDELRPEVRSLSVPPH